jgi:hypothetical protein
LPSKKLKLNVELDVLFLRAGPARSLLTGQDDIDNRLKVLFDALSVAATTGQALLLQGSGQKPHRAIARVGVRPAGHIYANQVFP